MKLEIERPQWDFMQDKITKKLTVPFLSEGNFNYFWKNEVEPINKLLREGVEVYSPEKNAKSPFWSTDDSKWSTGNSYKGLLINIQPIKQESAEGLLREIIEGDFYITEEQSFIERAKAVLERSEGGD